MEERNMPRRPRREKADDQPRNESLVYGKNPVTELLKSGSGVDTVLLAEGMAPAPRAIRAWLPLPVRSNTQRWRTCWPLPKRRANRPSSC